jgi:hypothetical protein
VAQRADALGDQVERVPLLGVLAHEHQVQVLNIGPVTFQWKLCVIR